MFCTVAIPIYLMNKIFCVPRRAMCKSSCGAMGKSSFSDLGPGHFSIARRVLLHRHLQGVPHSLQNHPWGSQAEIQVWEAGMDWEKRGERKDRNCVSWNQLSAGASSTFVLLIVGDGASTAQNLRERREMAIPFGVEARSMRRPPGAGDSDFKSPHTHTLPTILKPHTPHMLNLADVVTGG